MPPDTAPTYKFPLDATLPDTAPPLHAIWYSAADATLPNTMQPLPPCGDRWFDVMQNDAGWCQMVLSGIWYC